MSRELSSRSKITLYHYRKTKDSYMHSSSVISSQTCESLFDWTVPIDIARKMVDSRGRSCREDLRNE